MPSYINTEFKNLMRTRTRLGRATRTSNIAKYNNGKKRVFCYAPPNEDGFAYTSKLGEYADAAGDMCIRTEDGKPIAFMMGDSHLHVLTRDEGVIEAAISDLLGVKKILRCSSVRELAAQKITSRISQADQSFRLIQDEGECIDVIKNMIDRFGRRSLESLEADVNMMERQLKIMRARLWLSYQARECERDIGLGEYIRVSLRYTDNLHSIDISESTEYARIDSLRDSIQRQEARILEIKNEIERYANNNNIDINRIPEDIFVVYRDNIEYMAWLINPFLMSVEGRQYSMLDDYAVILLRLETSSQVRTGIILGDEDARRACVHPHVQSSALHRYRNLCTGDASAQIASMIRGTEISNATVPSMVASVASSMINYSSHPYVSISNFSNRIV